MIGPNYQAVYFSDATAPAKFIILRRFNRRPSLTMTNLYPQPLRRDVKINLKARFQEFRIVLSRRTLRVVPQSPYHPIARQSKPAHALPASRLSSTTGGYACPDHLPNRPCSPPRKRCPSRGEDDTNRNLKPLSAVSNIYCIMVGLRR